LGRELRCFRWRRGGEYRQLYLAGNRNLIDGSQRRRQKKFVYTSSTSVYAQERWVAREGNQPDGAGRKRPRFSWRRKSFARSRAKKKFPAVILRVAGIYGPERGYLLKQYLKNEARIEGKGERALNMIHRDDLIGVIIAALKSGRPGEIYNAVDDEPVSQWRFFEWLAGTLDKDVPPAATEDAEANRKRGVTNKKVSNRKLKMELGYQFKYPNFRKRLHSGNHAAEAAGLLDIPPEDRGQGWPRSEPDASSR
jgi:nucleoside-diphosphate-sugar epimerase